MPPQNTNPPVVIVMPPPYEGEPEKVPLVDSAPGTGSVDLMTLIGARFLGHFSGYLGIFLLVVFFDVFGFMMGFVLASTLSGYNGLKSAAGLLILRHTFYLKWLHDQQELNGDSNATLVHEGHYSGHCHEMALENYSERFFWMNMVLGCMFWLAGAAQFNRATRVFKTAFQATRA